MFLQNALYQNIVQNTRTCMRNPLHILDEKDKKNSVLTFEETFFQLGQPRPLFVHFYSYQTQILRNKL